MVWKSIRREDSTSCTGELIKTLKNYSYVYVCLVSLLNSVSYQFIFQFRLKKKIFRDRVSKSLRKNWMMLLGLWLGLQMIYMLRMQSKCIKKEQFHDICPHTDSMIHISNVVKVYLVASLTYLCSHLTSIVMIHLVHFPQK